MFRASCKVLKIQVLSVEVDSSCVYELELRLQNSPLAAMYHGGKDMRMPALCSYSILLAIEEVD